MIEGAIWRVIQEALNYFRLWSRALRLCMLSRYFSDLNNHIALKKKKSGLIVVHIRCCVQPPLAAKAPLFEIQSLFSKDFYLCVDFILFHFIYLYIYIFFFVEFYFYINHFQTLLRAVKIKLVVLHFTVHC